MLQEAYGQQGFLADYRDMVRRLFNRLSEKLPEILAQESVHSRIIYISVLKKTKVAIYVVDK